LPATTRGIGAPGARRNRRGSRVEEKEYLEIGIEPHLIALSAEHANAFGDPPGIPLGDIEPAAR
jgi:hypothetical protein